MKASDVFMDFIFDVCLPTVDVYTDIALIYRYMFIPQCKDVGFDIRDSVLQSIKFDPTGEKIVIDRNSWAKEAFGELLNFLEDETVFNSCNEMGTNPKYGLLMLCPIIISMIFIFGQWLRMEDSTKKRLYTLLLLLLQLYPQYRTLKVLYKALWKRDIRWKKDKEMLQRNLKSIGRVTRQFQSTAMTKKSLTILGI